MSKSLVSEDLQLSLQRATIAKALDFYRQSLQRSLSKEVMGSEMYKIRADQLKFVDDLILSFRSGNLNS